MTVAYYLILDHKRRKMLGASPIMHATQQQVLPNPRPPSPARLPPPYRPFPSLPHCPPLANTTGVPLPPLANLCTATRSA